MDTAQETEDIQEEEAQQAPPPAAEEAAEEAKEEAKEEDYKGKYYYLAAEMENLRRRHGREREELLKYGTQRVMGDLLGVVDNLERALEAIEGEGNEKVKNIFMGIDMVRGQFLEALKNNGLVALEALGQKFDPNFHEAMGQREDGERAHGEIVVEHQRGYTLNGRLLRPSKVTIVKNTNNNREGEQNNG